MMNETPDDYCLKFKLSTELKKYFRAASKVHSGSEIPDTLRESMKNNLNDSVELDHLIWLRESLPDNVHIHKLIEHCDIVLPSPKIEPRNPELEARIQKLRRMEEERKYKEMTKNVDPIRARQPDDSIAHQLKEMNRQLIGVFQILLSVASGFAFGFIGIEWMVGTLHPGVRLLLGIAIAAVIAIAEIYFFVKKLSEPLLMDDKKTT